MSEKVTIGIDFGHAETSAAYCLPGETAKTCMIQKRNSIPSVILYLPDDKKLIGFDAYRELGNIAEGDTLYPEWEMKLAWKKRPSKMSGNDRMDCTEFMRLYFCLLMDSLKESMPITEENIEFYLSVPSSWMFKTRKDSMSEREKTSEEYDAYRAMAVEAGFPENVSIIPESRSAMVAGRARHHLGDGMEIIKRGILVIDIGSSTLDFTYVKDFQIKDDGVELGAGLIDQLIMRHSINQSDIKEKILAHFSEYPAARSHALYEVRRFKEEFCLGNCVRSRSFTILKSDGRLEFKCIMPRGGIEQVIENEQIAYGLELLSLDNTMGIGSWRELLKQSMRRIQEIWSLGDSENLGVVFVTGGPSKMSFFLDDVKSVFGNACYRDDEPATTIAHGIALIGRADLDSVLLEKELKEHIAVAKMQKIPELSSSILNFMVDSMVKAMWDKMKLEINNFRFGSPTDLEGRIKKSLEKGISVSTSIYTDVAKQIKDFAGSEISLVVIKITQKYGFSDSSNTMEVTKVKVDNHLKSLEKTLLQSVDLNEIIKNALSELDFVEAIILTLFAPIIIVGVVIAGIAEGVIEMFKSEEQSKYDKIMAEAKAKKEDEAKRRKPLTPDEINKLKRNFYAKKEDICSKWTAVISEEFKKNKVEAKMADAIEKTIDAYVEEQLKVARFAIVE